MRRQVSIGEEVRRSAPRVVLGQQLSPVESRTKQTAQPLRSSGPRNLRSTLPVPGIRALSVIDRPAVVLGQSLRHLQGSVADVCLDGLADARQPGVACTIGDDVVDAVVVETLESIAPDTTDWSTCGLAAKHGISHTTVGEIWRGVWAQAVAS